MNIGDVIAGALARNCVAVQYLHECCLGATAVKAKKNTPAHCRVTFATTNMAPSDLLQPKLKQVALIVWIPREDYDAIEAASPVKDTHD